MANRLTTNGGSGAGMSGLSFDAFVSSQRSHYQDNDWAVKLQEKYWRAKQKFLAKVEGREDSCIILSDSKLDAKLGIFRSIDKSCGRLTEILEAYQNSLFVFANEENALGVLLKECGKHDRTKAGKIMTITGRSLTQSSHHRIKLYMPLMRLYQEMETFYSRAVEDTALTVDDLESKRSQYRASLMWMKDVSTKLDPDIYRQLEKFRRVQAKVRDDKRTFDSIQMDVVQKIDLLMASRCNLMNQIIAPYQATLLETFQKNYESFSALEELLKREDIYEYEFKTLKQLNPLRLDHDDQSYETKHLEVPKDETRTEDAQEAVNLLIMDEEPKSLEDKGSNRNNNNNNNEEENVSNLKLLSDELYPRTNDTLNQVNNALIDFSFEDKKTTNATAGPSRQATDLDKLIEEPTDTLELLNSLFGKDESKSDRDDSKQTIIGDLLSDELELIDNSSYFKSLQGLQI